MTEKGESGQRSGATRQAKGVDSSAPLVGIVAHPDCLASGVLGMVDAIALANTFSLLFGNVAPQIEARVVSPSGEAARAFGSQMLEVHGRLEEIESANAIVVAPVVADIGQSIEQHRSSVEWLRMMWNRGSTVTAVCTGAFFLAETGLLDQRRATTNPSFGLLFSERYPTVHLDTTLRLADEGRLLTAGATTSCYDLILELIGRYLGAEVALQTARELLTDPSPGSQRAFASPRPRAQHNDSSVRSVQTRIERDYGAPLEVDDLARSAGMSSRTLARRFRDATGESPREYVQRTRVEAAMRMLAGTDRSVEQITQHCGYEDTRSFRRMFRQQTDLSPREYRKRFGVAKRAWRT